MDVTNVAKGTHILFQGDSITDGGRGKDLNHHLGHGYVYLIASRLGAEFPEKELEFTNRGKSGNRIADIYGRWQEDALLLEPNMISLLAGVNDVNFLAKRDLPDDGGRFARVYRQLVEETRDQLPNTKLILCEPFILNTGIPQEKWSFWEHDMSIKQETVRNLAAEFKLTLVPLQSMFEEACTKAPAVYWLWDGVHPTAAGHELIARRWLGTVLRETDA